MKSVLAVLVVALGLVGCSALNPTVAPECNEAVKVCPSPNGPAPSDAGSAGEGVAAPY